MYSYGYTPSLLPGENPLKKTSIPIIMKDANHPPLLPSSRICFSIHYPIQYNLKVKDVGHVHPDYLQSLLHYWAAENRDQATEATAEDQAKREETHGSDTVPSQNASTANLP